MKMCETLQKMISTVMFWIEITQPLHHGLSSSPCSTLALAYRSLFCFFAFVIRFVSQYDEFFNP